MKEYSSKVVGNPSRGGKGIDEGLVVGISSVADGECTPNYIQT
jgi:hypothetical protein